MYKSKFSKKNLNIFCLLIIVVCFSLFAATSIAAYRPAVVGVEGLVTSANSLASQAGLDILKKGGNAIDAAVAVAATLHVVEFHASGLDGNGFATIYWAPENKVYSVGMTGAVPYAADLKNLTKEEVDIGYKAGCVPGVFGGWIETMQKFGTMSLAEVMESAINYAENGFPVTPVFQSNIESNKINFELYPTSARVFLPGGKVPAVGEMFYMKDLANTYRKLVAAEQMALAQGKSRNEALQAAYDRFYTGDIAQEIVRFYQENGGFFTAEDLADYKPVWKEPLHTNYRGYDVFISPSTSRTGYEVCMQLNLIEGFDLQALGHNSADYLHLVFESIKLAKSDIYQYVADEAFVDIPTEAMLSKEYADVRRELIDMDKAMEFPEAGVPEELKAVAQLSNAIAYREQIIDDGETTNFEVIDSFGNAVGVTPTHGSFFGTRVVVGNTGLLFNNGTRYGSIAPYEDNVNYLEGGKISLLGNGPAVVMKDGKPFMIYGTPGGEGIGQTTFQVLLNVVDFGMGIQDAIEAPRGTLSANPDFYTPGAAITVGLESRIPEEVIKEFEAKGHTIRLYPEFTSSVGGMQGIIIHPEFGTWTAGADPRREGYAIAGRYSTILILLNIFCCWRPKSF